MGTYSYSGAPQFVTVGQSGTYDITAFGGSGGGAHNGTGGGGSEVGGIFVLKAGEKLEIIAGGAGSFGMSQGGGGGGSFVLADVDAQGNLTPGSYRLLLAAGGGGGAQSLNNGGGGSSATSGGGAGGTSGAYSGGGGSGYRSNGANSTGNGITYSSGGANRAGGYAGGQAVGNFGLSNEAGKGGFGGGGGGSSSNPFVGGPGGGGGYSGGAGGSTNTSDGSGPYTFTSGSGGTSINRGIPIAAQTQSGFNFGNGRVDLSTTITCFGTGTLIRTVRGEVEVERLRVGDLVVTSSGEHRPIRWIGQQTLAVHDAPQPRSAWPVRVAAGAFGPDRPARDLFLSPGHAVCVSLVGEVLVPVQELVNGSTIAYVENAGEVTYWHVELDSHDVLIANGLPAESFLEMGDNRRFFAGEGAVDVSAEVRARSHADFCRRFVDGGPLLAALRDELGLRAREIGWQPSRTVAITGRADGAELHPLVEGGTAVFAVPAGVGDLRIGTDMTVPALMGEPDARRVGIAVYRVSVHAVTGDARVLDLDDPAVRGCFHPGERDEGRSYRFTAGDLVLPPSLTAGLAGPLLLRLAFEPGTVRGWVAPERAERPALRIVAGREAAGA